ncbi:hypothetical protein PQR62_22870 [Herbaspirillum lusitanum]|uniref:Uncharacterized protein n=1 Tax=Herbaspirillum lusitanum TaxID=213312 RepID=A0ABW9AFV8_9BURK
MTAKENACEEFEIKNDFSSLYPGLPQKHRKFFRKFSIQIGEIRSPQKITAGNHLSMNAGGNGKTQFFNF